ncbi:MAG: hypothetical protein J5878_02465 [Oscillospiraceae bacterium]|nr:hypothetical protein [Oscillospiraceae bacterium]
MISTLFVLLVPILAFSTPASFVAALFCLLKALIAYIRSSRSQNSDLRVFYIDEMHRSLKKAAVLGIVFACLFVLLSVISGLILANM